MTWIIALLAIGLFLLAAEVLVPGGILGAIGGVFLLVGSVVSFIELGSAGGLITLLGAVVAGIIVFTIQLKILPKTALGKRFFLDHQIKSTAAPVQNELKNLIGKQAKAITALAPSGYIVLDGHRYEAISQSGLIIAETNIEVVDVTPFQLTVKII